MATMKRRLVLEGNSVYVEKSDFRSSHGVGESHTMIHICSNVSLSAQQQITLLFSSYRQLLEGEMTGYQPVFRRFFLSDAANQVSLLREQFALETSEVATSVVEQPPLDGTKVALWVYWLEGVESKRLASGLYQVSHGKYSHYWSGTTVVAQGDSRQQTVELLSDYATQLKAEGLSLRDDCIRTWFFVQNVDVNYGGVVEGRNEVFDLHNLTSETHFISSTGIGGRTANPAELVQLNAYAVRGLSQQQIKFLYAKEFLNSTYEYGVRFERGTAVSYGDRKQLFISGTASINNRGEVVHVGEIDKQVVRMLDNVEALLAEGGCGYEDVMHTIVYLRDPSDYHLVSRMFEERFPQMPKVFLLAPVCRPTWLIEMECMAVKECSDERWENL